MYYIVGNNILTGIGGEASTISFFKKSEKEDLLLGVLQELLISALNDNNVELINGEEREDVSFCDINLLDEGITVTYKASSYGASFTVIDYKIISDDNVECI